MAKLNAIISTLNTVNSNTNTINTNISSISTSVGTSSNTASQTGTTIQAKVKYIANILASLNTTISTINTNAANASNYAYSASVNSGNGAIRHIQHVWMHPKETDYNLSGFTNLNKMLVIFANHNTHGNTNSSVVGVTQLTTSFLKVNFSGYTSLSSIDYNTISGLIQVVEFY